MVDDNHCALHQIFWLHTALPFFYRLDSRSSTSSTIVPAPLFPQLSYFVTLTQTKSPSTYFFQTALKQPWSQTAGHISLTANSYHQSQQGPQNYLANAIQLFTHHFHSHNQLFPFVWNLFKLSTFPQPLLKQMTLSCMSQRKEKPIHRNSFDFPLIDLQT